MVFISLGIIILFSFIGIVYLKRTYYLDILNNRDSRVEIIEKLENPEFWGPFKQTYSRKAATILNWLDFLFGKKNSAQALVSHTGLALFYSIRLFTISWIVDSHQTGSAVVFTDSIPIPNKLLPRAIVGILFLLIYFRKKIAGWAMNRYFYKIKDKVGNLIGSVLLIFGIGSGAVSVAVAFAVVESNFSYFRMYVSAIIGIGFLLIGVFYFSKFLNNQTIFYLFFIILLPWINGLFDFISFWISRVLIERIVKSHSKKNALITIIIDAIFAVVLLAAQIFSNALSLFASVG